MDIKRPQSNQPLPQHAKKVFQGHLFSVYQWQQKMYDGTFETFEKIARRDTVGVIAVTTDKNILVTEQEQPGIARFFGTPGGIIDAGEEPFPAAQRELLEETGYVSQDWSLFDATQPTTKIDWAIFVFVAKNCKKIKEPRLDAGEKISLKLIDWDKFMILITQETFRDKDLALKLLRAKAKGQLEDLKRKILE